LEEVMNMQKIRRQIAIGTLALGVALAAAPAFAQTAGPGGAYFGAGSGPQSGNQPASASQTQPAHNTAGQSKKLYNSTAAQQEPGNGPAGPAGANYGAASNPQNGR
jgi:hypothetical protein